MHSLITLIFVISSIIVFLDIVLILAPTYLPVYNGKHASLSPESHRFQASKPNLWADLDDLEFDDVLSFVYCQKFLNLTRGAEATALENRISLLVEALRPNKTDALRYLDGSSEAPGRWARVAVNQGTDHQERAIHDYMGLITWLSTKLDDVADIALDLLGSVPSHFNPFNPDGLDPIPRIAGIEQGRMVLWLQFYRAGLKSDARSLLPQGLYAKLDIPTQDFSTWVITQWYYNGIIYNSTEMFRAAWRGPDFEKVQQNRDGDWTDIEDYSRGPSGREKPPPVMVQPCGTRYEVDRDEKFVSWMGFKFYIAFSQSTGLSLFDIKFKDERIIYELGMQEALVHYAGDDPTQGGQYFLDTLFNMGTRYDCPAYATYLSTSYHVNDFTSTNENNICLFEYTADHPLQRHTTPTSVSISRSQYLVLRSVSTVGNYDYTIDYLFYLDGSIEVKYRASGFIFGAFYASSGNSTKAPANEYGYRVHDAVSTSIHDHVINFKADLDIAGTSNTLMRVGIEPLSKTFPWDEAGGPPRNTMHLTHTPVNEETGLAWPRNSGEMFIVLNEDSTNAWGEKRGYRIMPGTGMGTPSHLTILNSTGLKKAAEWAGKDLWVVKQKDTEPKSASPLNFVEPDNPLVDFAKFVDGEEITQEDLVIFFNLGSHHIAHSGDIPNTLMHTSASSVIFMPHNFHDRDPSREAVQGVKVEIGAGAPAPRYFGGRYKESVRLNVTDLEPDLSIYHATRHDVTDLSLNQSILGL
ncbi:hypothetical protein MMC13_001024 [Lambiella insularis]|nr:hypothetical protein [Lambiella insularis]